MAELWWERVAGSDELGGERELWRIRVPGGWLYRAYDVHALTFVPDPVETVDELQNERDKWHRMADARAVQLAQIDQTVASLQAALQRRGEMQRKGLAEQARLESELGDRATTIAELVHALRRILELISKAGGPGPLSKGVELGPLSWCAKMSDAIVAAEAVIDVTGQKPPES